MPSELSWCAGAGYVDADVATTPVPETPHEELEDISPPAIIIDSIARLVERKQSSGELDRWKLNISNLPVLETQTLILRVGTTGDPLTLWALHVNLDKRDIAPCLRWPGNLETPQMHLVTWLADLLWLAKRNRGHLAKFRSWQRLMQDEPGSALWLARAHRIFIAMYGRQNVSAYTARGLALSPEQRHALMTLPTSRMVAVRLGLRAEAFAETREVLLTHSMAHPDKSGAHTPDSIANRRARLWRVHVLLGKRPAETARNWAALTGETATRQVIARQLDTIEAVLKGAQ